jgi:hypothetical protein
MTNPSIDAGSASFDTESEMVSMHGRAETYAIAAAPSGWNVPPGWASVLPSRLKAPVIQGENCEIQG